jgi:hypothetical protein
MKIITALLNPDDLLSAISDLTDIGFTYKEISLISSVENVPQFLEGEPETKALGGAAAGAAAGGLAGALGAWVAPSIPGFEAMLATGLLTTAAGSVIGGFLGSIYTVRAESQTKLDVHEALEAGSILLLVADYGARAEQAAAILDEHDAQHIEIHELPEGETFSAR